ncbi:ribonuclease HI family protein [Uliginosibacterium sp. TH139]|uniref:ribonuclease HI family protein n=1 Tax=Uliginosibacterium sp. TH139 TaxID=2067453 RepID=UPI000C7C2E15|nr:ribonuclease HI family protein [Uliginosibacterium sp. TH139]PLK50854.1 ribonuclease H [Uliginosibacterium sp. TH139]
MNEDFLWQAWCDGCARPNPGHIGLGAILLGPQGGRHELSERSPHTGCNNEAEARALLATLKLARALGAAHLQVQCDSDVVVRLAQDAETTEAARLAPLFAEIRQLGAEFSRLELRWLPQHRNTAADQLARAALGLPPRAPAKPARRKR